MEEGKYHVPNAAITFSSSIIPIHIELKPSACAASCEYAPARVASCKENFLIILGGKFIFILSGFIQNTRTTGELTYGCLLDASTSFSLISGSLT